MDDGTFRTVSRLPGWTRGLCFVGNVAFVATSRVIPRFRQYAPGLDIDRSVCSVQAIDMSTGSRLESIRWPGGNQIYAVEAVPTSFSWGFPAGLRRAPRSERMTRLYYGFESQTKETPR